MLDLDFLCGRETPSVAGIINPGSEGFQKLFFGHEEIAIPLHATIEEAACAAHPTADVFINFASFRSAKLYRPGSVGFVSKSGGMSSEMYNTVARVTDGIYEGIAIGGDVFPGSTLSYHILRFNNIPQIKMMVVLGELGGRDEYSLVEALKQGKVKKNLLLLGSVELVARLFKSEVQFGHAGAKSGALESAIKDTFEKLVEEGKVSTIKEVTPPQIPEDLSFSIKSGKVRAPTHIISTISDDRGEEPCYAGVPILPRYCTKFIEICIMLCADHGPCVSGAHNTIVTPRAGKDLVSSLLTIGPRFGGAIDDAASTSRTHNLTPYEFVEGMKKKGIRVPGIGHRIKSRDNRDKRVELLQKFARSNFPSVKYMEYAVTVESYTLSKANNLVLNVDGAIGSLFLDLLAGSGMSSKQEIDEIVQIGYLNGLFVLARSIGLIGHTFDQKRWKQPLYRHPREDVLYTK
ncbi:ATP-citrate synthase beta chain protein 2 [Raphanus sativus]|nr:ATP-citrate synthase beta chain protein 2 [Raphanus sativus]